MLKSGRGAFLSAALLAVSACGGSAATPAAPTVTPTASATPAASVSSASPLAGSLLDKVMKAGKLVVATDPNARPLSEQQPDNSYQGFDIDVASEIAKRLGVRVAYVAAEASAVSKGGWAGAWDMSVGVTPTTGRAGALDFSPAYYFAPAQMTASSASGITTLEGLAGKAVCVGQGTTYEQWLKGTLDFGTGQTPAAPPAGISATALAKDTDCPEQWKAGRNDFQGWLSSETKVNRAIAGRLPVIRVGDPVFREPVAVAVDKSGPNDTAFVARVTSIVNDMRSDGTLNRFSMQWFGRDLTSPGA